MQLQHSRNLPEKLLLCCDASDLGLVIWTRDFGKDARTGYLLVSLKKMKTGYLLEQQEAALLEREPQGGHADGAFPLRGKRFPLRCQPQSLSEQLLIVRVDDLFASRMQGGHADGAFPLRGEP